MQVLSRENCVHTFSAAHPPKYEVDDGEVFWVEAEDAYRGEMKDPSVLRPHIKSTNWSTGPILVKNAKAGDVLCVEFLKFEFADQGAMPTNIGMGLLGDLIDAPTTRIVPVRGDYAIFSDDIHLPLTPMCGVCAVAPPGDEEYTCVWPGDFGGNMDTTKIAPGARLYLPVFHDGAKLFIGDFHACMGDGEVSGTGIEIAGRALVKVSVRKDIALKRPVVETDEAIYFLASEKTLDEAVRVSVLDAIHYMMDRLDLGFQDAYRLFSIACDTQISQVVDPLKTARARVPRFHEKVGRL